MQNAPLHDEARDRVFPLFADALVGPPHLFDFSSGAPRVRDWSVDDFDRFQAQVEEALRAAGAHWGIGRWLEERAVLLRQFPQMTEEGRVFHAGLDVVVPGGLPLHAPTDSVVHATGVDAGRGNYGGWVVLRLKDAHNPLAPVARYVLYGHLDSAFTVRAGDRLAAGQPFARTGTHDDAGGWFTHTHLQALTERALAEDRMLQGYVTAADLDRIEDWFPCPYPLFNARPRDPHACSGPGSRADEGGDR